MPACIMGSPHPPPQHNGCVLATAAWCTNSHLQHPLGHQISPRAELHPPGHQDLFHHLLLVAENRF